MNHKKSNFFHVWTVHSYKNDLASNTRHPPPFLQLSHIAVETRLFSAEDVHIKRNATKLSPSGPYFETLKNYKGIGLRLFVFGKKLHMQNISEKNKSLQVAHEQ